jgi:multicomponent Na+:H+ antiporter subunit E
MTRVRRWPVIGLGLAVLWLFVRGVTLTPDRVAAEFLTGLGFGLPIAYLLRNFYTREIDVGGTLRTLPALGAYTGLFLKELVTANVDVAYRVLAPSMPIQPAVIEVPLRVESDLAITTIANSITLTPGTLTMDYDDDTNTLYVHAISGGDREAVVEPIRAWEDYALRIFEEERAPADAVPPRPSARVSVAGRPDEAGESEPPASERPEADTEAGPVDPDGETPTEVEEDD